MSIRLPVPRLLPVTIAMIAIVLALKCAEAVRAVAPALAATAQAGGAVSAPADPGAAAMPAAPAVSTAAANVAPRAASGSDCGAATGQVGQTGQDGGAERVLLSDLRQRRQRLDAREAALAARDMEAQAAEKRLAQRADELATLEHRLQDLETQRQQRDEANWQGLVKVYETMKPSDAAAIFNDLDMAVLREVADRMRETKLAPVLAAMQTDRARVLTSELSRLRLRRNTIGAPSAPALGH